LSPHHHRTKYQGSTIVKERKELMLLLKQIVHEVTQFCKEPETLSWLQLDA